MKLDLMKNGKPLSITLKTPLYHHTSKNAEILNKIVTALKLKKQHKLEWY